MSNFARKAISRVQAGLIIGVIVIAGIIGVAYYNSLSPTPTQMSSTAATSPTSGTVNTLFIDAAFWPLDDLNQLYSQQELPWPNPLAFTVYQPLVTMNMSAEFEEGTVQYLPGLASWTVSPDGMTYTFSLKHNIQF